MKQLLFVLIVLLTGCAGESFDMVDATEVPVVTEPSPVVDHLSAEWTVSDQFTEGELESISAAFAAWQAVTKTLERPVTATFKVAPALEATPWTITREKLDDECCAAITAPSRDQIRIDAEDYPDVPCVGRLWHITAHELGHTFGIDHGGDGLMQEKKPSCDAVFEDSDIQLFIEANQ